MSEVELLATSLVVRDGAKLPLPPTTLVILLLPVSHTSAHASIESLSCEILFRIIWKGGS